MTIQFRITGNSEDVLPLYNLLKRCKSKYNLLSVNEPVRAYRNVKPPVVIGSSSLGRPFFSDEPEEVTCRVEISVKDFARMLRAALTVTERSLF